MYGNLIGLRDWLGGSLLIKPRRHVHVQKRGLTIVLVLSTLQVNAFLPGEGKLINKELDIFVKQFLKLNYVESLVQQLKYVCTSGFI